MDSTDQVREKISIPPTLIRSAKLGDEDATERILQLTHPICLGLIRKFHIHPNDFEDTVQDCVLSVLSCIERHDPERGEFTHYVCSTIYNLLLSKYRQRKKNTFQSIDFDHEPRTWDELSQIEALDAIQTLPQTKKVLVQEHYGIGGCQEQTLKQLAVRHALTVDEVRQLLGEAFSSLRSRLGVSYGS